MKKIIKAKTKKPVTKKSLKRRKDIISVYYLDNGKLRKGKIDLEDDFVVGPSRELTEVDPKEISETIRKIRELNKKKNKKKK